MRYSRYFATVFFIALCMTARGATDDKSAQTADEAKVAVISGFAGLLSGLVAAVVAPMVQWRFERNRNKHIYNQDVIRHARDHLHPGFRSATFLKTHSFFQLQPDLSPQIIFRLQNSSGAEAEEESIRLDLFAEIARIERVWFR